MVKIVKRKTVCSKCGGRQIEAFIKDNRIHGKYCSECGGKGYIWVVGRKKVLG